MMRRLLAVLLIFCLPLQLQAAMLMPICQHGLDGAVAPAQQSSHCQHDAGDSSAPAGHGDSCDRCGLCHLVVAMPVTPDLPAMPALRDYALPTGEGHLSHIPEAPQEPPRLG